VNHARNGRGGNLRVPRNVEQFGPRGVFAHRITLSLNSKGKRSPGFLKILKKPNVSLSERIPFYEKTVNTRPSSPLLKQLKRISISTVRRRLAGLGQDCPGVLARNVIRSRLCDL
jgi:hypothetical protein